MGNQARFLMTRFIYDRLRADGYEDVPQAEQLIEPGTPNGEYSCTANRLCVHNRAGEVYQTCGSMATGGH